jgi:hypothetical protein
MAVIKSLEKTYMLRTVGIPEYYLAVNVKFLGEARKNQGLELAFSEKTAFKTSFLNLKVFLEKILSLSRHP